MSTASDRRGCAAAVFLAVFIYGHYSLPAQPLGTRHQPLLSLKAALIQPNIDQYKKWSPEYEAEITSTLSQMGHSLAEKGVMLTVWPESTVPGSLTEETYLTLFEDIATQTGSYQFIGSNVEADGKQYVGAYLMTPNLDNLQSYRKIKLVPFGEYIPLESLVRRLLPQVTVLGELGSFSAGEWEQPLLKIDQIPLGVTICYESVFSRLWKAQAKAGARFFVNITNDAWFFDTDAPYQHLAVSVLRAVELRRPVLRAANTGISAIISPSGEILARAELNTRAVLRAEVPLPLGAYDSFYVRWGDWFAWVCAAIYFTILISVMVFAYE